MKKASSLLVLLIVLISPAFVVAAETAPKLDYSGFVKCDGVISKVRDPETGKMSIKPGEEERNRVCDFRYLMETILELINWMFMISVSVATVLFAYAGVLYMTGTSGNISTAKNIFRSVAIGFIIMLVAWIGVRTFVDWFVDDDSGATTFIE